MLSDESRVRCLRLILAGSAVIPASLSLARNAPFVGVFCLIGMLWLPLSTIAVLVLTTRKNFVYAFGVLWLNLIAYAVLAPMIVTFRE